MQKATRITLKKISASFAITILLSIITISIYIAKYVTGCDEINDEGECDRGDDREAEAWAKLLFATIWMIVVAGVMGIAGVMLLVRPSFVKVGVLGGALIMYSNLSLVCSMYYWNLQTPEEERGDRYLANGDYDDDAGEEEEEEVEGHAERVFSAICLGLALVYFVIGALVLASSMSMGLQDFEPSTGTATATNGEEEQEQYKSMGGGEASASQVGNVNILSDAWKYLSISSITAMVITLVLAISSLFVEEADRMKEEGYIWNFLVVAFWMLWMYVSFVLLGYRIFKKDSETKALEVGLFMGCLYFFVGVAFFMGLMYTSFRFERRGREEEPFGSTFFSFLCFVFGIAYVAFAQLVNKYQASILSATSGTMHDEEGNASNSFIELREQHSGRVV